MTASQDAREFLKIFVFMSRSDIILPFNFKVLLCLQVISEVDF